MKSKRERVLIPHLFLQKLVRIFIGASDAALQQTSVRKKLRKLRNCLLCLLDACMLYDAGNQNFQ